MPTARSTYYRRVLGALVGVLLGAIALVRGWPVLAPDAAPARFRDAPAERIQIRDVQPTQQAQEKTPAPPAPLPPVVVPEEVLIEEELEFGETSLSLDLDGEDATLQEGADRTATAPAPETGARLLRSVQPTYPPAARDDGVRARVEVSVQISKTGTVEAATVRRRWRVAPDGARTPVARLEHGLEEAALAAARQSLFRPARQGGRPVATQKVLTFTFGPE